MPKAWITEQDIIIERWAIRVATITDVTVDQALPCVRHFYAAGGTEDMLTKMERLVCEKGYRFTLLLDLASQLMK